LPELPPPAEFVEEIEEVEIDEPALESETEETADQAAPSQVEPSINGDVGARRKRRRRRRGRGDRAPQQGLQTGQPTSLPEERQDEERDDDDVEGEEGAPTGPTEHLENGHGAAPGEVGGKRRRRRRRRGRRGPREGQMYSSNDGVPVSASAHDHDAERPMLEAPADVVAPNTPSAPVWSLHPDEPREHAAAHTEPLVATPAPVLTSQRNDAWSAPRETAPSAPLHETIVEPTKVPTPETIAEKELSQPTRKGWWQRPFKLRD
jgi:ribonuclease E